MGLDREASDRWLEFLTDHRAGVHNDTAMKQALALMAQTDDWTDVLSLRQRTEDGSRTATCLEARRRMMHARSQEKLNTRQFKEVIQTGDLEEQDEPMAIGKGMSDWADTAQCAERKQESSAGPDSCQSGDRG